jgi:hypothetical protein
MAGYSGYPTADQTCSSDPGICLDGNSSGQIKVSGSVFSNASGASAPSITSQNNVTLQAPDDSVMGTGTCGPSGKILGEPLVCPSTNPASVPDPGGAVNVDPVSPNRWASDIQTMPAEAPKPTCNATTKVATMVPGSYFDRNQMLQGFANGSALCTVVWMQPGNYYLDFDQATENDPWRIGWDDLDRAQGVDAPGRVVIGGTRKGWDSTTPASTVITKVPGACDKTQPGVQVVLAGLSAFDVKHQGRLELCPNPNTDRQQIAVYGRKTNQSVSPQTVTFKPSSVTSPGPTPSSLGTPDTNLWSIDGLSTSGTQTGSSKKNTLTLAGYATTSSLSPQASLGSVTLRIAHQETTSPSSSGVTISVKITLADGSSPSACTSTTAFGKRTTMTTDSWSVPSSCVDSVSELAGAKVQWDVTGPSGSSSSLTTAIDGMELNATYTPRALEKKTDRSKIVWLYGEHAGGYTGPLQPEIYIYGTVYAPTSRIELNFGSVSVTKAQFTRGVVVDFIKITDLTVGQSYPAFSNTDDAHYTDRYLELVVKQGSDRLLRAVVKLGDSTGAGKTITIVSWNAVGTR